MKRHYREDLVGEALRRLMEKGTVKREDVFLQTKYTPPVEVWEGSFSAADIPAITTARPRPSIYPVQSQGIRTGAGRRPLARKILGQRQID